MQSPVTVEPIKAQLTHLSEGFKHRPGWDPHAGLEAAGEVKGKGREECWARETNGNNLFSELLMNFR